MIQFVFKKERLAELLQAQKAGAPIQPDKEGWSAHDALTIAGAFAAQAISHGPGAYRVKGHEADHPEHKEAREQDFAEEMMRVIAAVVQLAFQIEDGNYKLPDSFVGTLRITANGESRLGITPIPEIEAN